MKTILKAILLFSFAAAVFTSCKKYPDGPGFTLLSRKARLANTWHMGSYKENNVDKTSDFNNIFQNAVFTMTKEGAYTLSYKFLGLSDYNESGTWRFTDNDAYFETNPNSGSGTTGKHYILKLKDKELWYTDTDSSFVREYHLIP